MLCIWIIVAAFGVACMPESARDQKRPVEADADTDGDTDSDADADSDSDTDADTDGPSPALEISPNPIDFGTSYVGCPQYKEVALTNLGTDALAISSIVYAGDSEIVLIEDLALPVELEPSASTTLTLTFTPNDETEYSGQLTVASDDPAGTHVIDTLGDGQFAGDFVETWEVTGDPPSDIMFAVDQSGTMGDDQTRLASNFTTFMNGLSSFTSDWQIIVANDDDGCNRSSILTPETEDYVEKFEAAVSGGGGSYTESLLTVGANAIENTDAGDCNDTFMRSDAMLHLVLVSDEPDQSSWTSGLAWGDLVQQIIDKKGYTSRVHISAVAGPDPGGCESADAGTGYSDAVAATGGVFLSICSDWASPSGLALLAEASVSLDTFLLTEHPVEETIVVRVNGMSVTTWTYDGTDNAVVFSDNVPGEGDAVEIAYSGMPSCE